MKRKPTSAAACRVVQFPWVHVRPDVFSANGRGLSRARPARKKVLAVCHQLNEVVRKLPTFIRPEALVYQVNQMLRGWANYFCYGTYTSAHDRASSRLPSDPSVVASEVRYRRKGYRQYPDSYLERAGPAEPPTLPRRYSWANP